jgi:hypothetical protein
MRSSFFKPSPRLCGAAFAAIAAVALSSGRANAECGDYVHIVKDGIAADGSPCRGPGCSNKPATPDLPMTASSTERTGAKLVAACDLAAEGSPECTRTRFPCSIGLPNHISTPIFHPPRFA